MELKADNVFISQCEDYLETWGNTLAMYGKLGSGKFKRTLAAQVALRLAKKDSKLKIKIVIGSDDISNDLKSMRSTIFVMHDPVKTWFTFKHTQEIVSCLSKMCLNAKKNNNYLIGIFHFDDWKSFSRQMGETKKVIEAMEQMFTSKKHVSCTTQKLHEMAMIKKMDISNLTTRIWEASVGYPLIVTLYLKKIVSFIMVIFYPMQLSLFLKN